MSGQNRRLGSISSCAIIAAAAAALAVNSTIFTAPARAANVVAYDNFGPGTTYQNSGTWFGDNFNLHDLEATSFVPSVTGTLQGITAGIFYGDGADSFQISLRADNANKPAAAVLWSGTYNDMLGSFGSSISLTNLGGPNLQSGVKYWLVANAPTGSHHNWYDGMSGIDATARSQNNEATWQVFNNFTGRSLRVTLDSTTVPEPGAAVAGAVVLSGAMLRRRRR